jgi:hypothetical protein
MVKVTKKPQRLALRRLLLRNMRIGSRFRLLHSGWWGRLRGRLRGHETPIYQTA